jgi:hypothetical protein
MKFISEHKFEVFSAHNKYELYLKGSCPDIRITSEALVALQLLPSMMENKDIFLEESLDDKFNLNVSVSIQDIVKFWWNNLFNVEINSSKISSANIHEGSGSACFFTGGVDSFYTLLSLKDEISTIIYVHGFDVKLSDHALRKQISDNLKEIAENNNVRLIEFETNIKEYLDDFLHWEFTHGAALAFIAHTIKSQIDQVFIAGSHTLAQEDLYGWGTHPVLDHFWSSSNLRFISHGWNCSRFQKIKYISNHDIAKDHLRVCWANRNGAYNCGMCEKCYRTMLSLYVLNKLDDFRTFDAPFSVRKLYSFSIRERNTMSFLRDNMNALSNSDVSQFDKLFLKIIYLIHFIKYHAKQLEKR